jgi:hypothetical protein
VACLALTLLRAAVGWAPAQWQLHNVGRLAMDADALCVTAELTGNHRTNPTQHFVTKAILLYMVVQNVQTRTQRTAAHP